jgi:hypothetical protein
MREIFGIGRTSRGPAFRLKARNYFRKAILIFGVVAAVASVSDVRIDYHNIPGMGLRMAWALFSKCIAFAVLVVGSELARTGLYSGLRDLLRYLRWGSIYYISNGVSKKSTDFQMAVDKSAKFIASSLVVVAGGSVYIYFFFLREGIIPNMGDLAPIILATLFIQGMLIRKVRSRWEALGHH